MSTVPATLSVHPLSLDQLAALSEEIAALARAGVPLDRGLTELGRDIPGRLGQVARSMGERLGEGQAVEQVVADLGSALPPAYRSVLIAGVRAGRLPMALQDISQTARRISQLRSMIYLSLLYPLMVLIVTWVLSVFVLLVIGPVLARTMVEFDVAGPWVVNFYDAAARHAIWIGPLLPILFGVWLLTAWIRAGRIARGAELHPLLSFGAVGTLARLQRASRLGTLSDLLALLIGNFVPLAEAVELASSAIGSNAIATGGQELAQRLARGETVQHAPAGFPPLLAWTITGARSQSQLVRSLRRAAEVYRDEAARRSQWLMVYVPLVATIGICGGLVLAYAALTLGPWLALLYRISLPY
jgi:general secretion pathway protein F